MGAKKRKYKMHFRNGDPLLIAAAGLLGALGDADEFPQDQAGIEALIAGAPRGPDGEELWATYEAPDGPLTYKGRGTWVGPAGDGRLRVRKLADGVDYLASRVWVLGPDGSLTDPELVEGFGVPENELPEAAQAELEERERKREEMLARVPEMERRDEEREDRFRVKHLLGVVAGPPGQDQSGPMVSHVALYDTGAIVYYLMPRPRPEDLNPDDPWATRETKPKRIELDDGLGTEFQEWTGGFDTNGSGLLRGRREFTPAVPAAASRLLVDIDGTSVEIELEP